MKKIQLSRGLHVLVDDEDYPRLYRLNWSVGVCGGLQYAVRNEHIDCPKGEAHQKRVYMHREIIGALKKEIVDHKNGNTLDNRRANLRLATHRQNMINGKLRVNNTSGYPGVSKHKGGKYQVRVKNPNGKGSIYSGLFESPEDGYRAYKKIIEEVYGEFAPHLNRPSRRVQ